MNVICMFLGQAATAVGGVKRLVVTSSVAACSGGFDVGGQYTEEDWTDPKNQVIGAYVRSKVRLI